MNATCYLFPPLLLSFILQPNITWELPKGALRDWNISANNVDLSDIVLCNKTTTIVEKGAIMHKCIETRETAYLNRE